MMAKVSMIAKSQKPPKYPARQHNRCRICGRARGYRRVTGTCRICFRELAMSGKLPGVTKSSF